MTFRLNLLNRCSVCVNGTAEFGRCITSVVNGKSLKCNMSLNVHCLQWHQAFFSQNAEEASYKQSERFHEGRREIKTLYKWKWSP